MFSNGFERMLVCQNATNCYKKRFFLCHSDFELVQQICKIFIVSINTFATHCEDCVSL